MEPRVKVHCANADCQMEQDDTEPLVACPKCGSIFLVAGLDPPKVIEIKSAWDLTAKDKLLLKALRIAPGDRPVRKDYR